MASNISRRHREREKQAWATNGKSGESAPMWSQNTGAITANMPMTPMNVRVKLMSAAADPVSPSCWARSVATA